MKVEFPKLELHYFTNLTYRRDSPYVRQQSADIQKIGNVSKEVTVVASSNINTRSDPVNDDHNTSIGKKSVKKTCSNWGTRKRQKITGSLKFRKTIRNGIKMLVKK